MVTIAELKIILKNSTSSSIYVNTLGYIGQISYCCDARISVSSGMNYVRKESVLKLLAGHEEELARRNNGTMEKGHGTLTYAFIKLSSEKGLQN